MTLTVLEIVFGIDNIIFISILIKRMPEAQRARSRVLGLGLAMLTRIRLLHSQAWVTNLTTPFFSVVSREISGRGCSGRAPWESKAASKAGRSAGRREHRPVSRRFSP